MNKKAFSKEKINNDTAHYPIVLIPNGIINSLSVEINDKFIASRLFLEEPRIPAPTNYKKSFNTGALPGILLLSLFVIMLIVFGVFLLKKGSIGGIGPLGIGLYMIRYVLYEVVKENTGIVESLKLHLIIILKKYKIYPRKYTKKNVPDIITFVEKVNNYYGTIKANRDNVLHDYLQEIHYPTTSINADKINLKRGSSEIKFLSYLIKEFGNEIKVDGIVSFNKKLYQPDFVYISKDTGLCIDIEIDEPYTFANKEPIHFDDIDKERNNAFLDNNWCVVRFSEKQISQGPRTCVMFLKELIDMLLLKRIDFEVPINFEEKWSYEKALVMADNDYRLSYKLL